MFKTLQEILCLTVHFPKHEAECKDIGPETLRHLDGGINLADYGLS